MRPRRLIGAEPGSAKEVGFKIRGRAITYESKEKARDNSLSSADLKGNMLLKNGRFKIRILLDRASIEVYGNDGEVPIPSCYLPPANDKTITVFATGGTARIVSLSAWPMRSVWRA